ncbi:hypothetical protein B0H14DRAFT_3436910 [Mycena olivaceomarginata]|nr:hypothetical protein B0H14DRAFT_3436910 [Mycena olivaceomarginata]
MLGRGTDAQTLNYYMNVSGGVGGHGGMSERGTGGDGGIGQGPTLNYNVRATHFTVNNLPTGSAAVPGSSAQI